MRTRILARRYPLNSYHNVWLEVGIAVALEPRVEIALIDRQKKEIQLSEEAFEKLHDQRNCILRYLADMGSTYQSEILNFGEVKMKFGTVEERGTVCFSMHDIDILLVEDTCKTVMRLHDIVKNKIMLLKTALPMVKSQLDAFVGIVKGLEDKQHAHTAITSSSQFRKSEDLDHELSVLALDDIIRMAGDQ